MSIKRQVRKMLLATFFVVTLVGIGAMKSAIAQQPSTSPQQRPRPPIITSPQIERVPATVAGETNLYCAGYVSLEPFTDRGQIVGAEQEQEKFLYAQGAYVYVNAGAQQGVREGQEFMVVRPHGQLRHVFKQKRGSLGVYFQELGRLRLIKVKEQVSIAQIVGSCSEMMLGDLVTEIPSRSSPTERPEVTLDYFSDSSGKPTGRVMMARDGREAPTRNDVIYVDLGTEDNLKAGDHLTIFRHVGKGNLFNIRNDDIAPGSLGGFSSNRFRGGGFSNGATRAREKKSGFFTGHPITTTEVKRHRPLLPRKVVGEAVVTNVQHRTATAIITRVAEEIHTGDWVEIQ